MKFRIKFADQVVGLFVIIAFIALAGSMIFIGINQRWFAKNYYYFSQFQSGSGLAPGTAIQLKGFTIGKIDSSILNEQNFVDVTFYIYDTYHDKIKVNSVLELSISPIGLGSQLLLHPGKGTSLAEENSFIPSMSMQEGMDLVENELVDIPVKDDTITRLLANINPLLENVNRTVMNTNKTIIELNKALSGQSDGPLGRIVNSADSSISSISSMLAKTDERLPQLINTTENIVLSVQKVMTDLGTLSDSIKDPTGLIPKLLDPQGSVKMFLNDNGKLFDTISIMLSDVKKTLANVEKISESIKAEVPKLSSILDEGKLTLQKTQDVLEGLKNNPLLKGGIPERQSQESKLESLRNEGF